MIPTLRNWLGITIPQGSLALFFDGMSVLLGSGRSISEALANRTQGALDPELKTICDAIAPLVRDGVTLADCLRPYASRFPEIVIPVIEVGEASGTLPDATQRLADTFKQTIGVEREFKVKAYDPKLVFIGFCFLVVIFEILGAISSLKSDPPLIQMVISLIVRSATVIFSAAVSILVGRMVLRSLFRLDSFRLAVDTIKLSLPRHGIVSRNLSAARWARSFAVLWAAGVNISTALEISSASALNAHYEQAFRLAAQQTRQGQSLSECLARTQLLPQHLLSVIAVCETAGRLDDSLLIMAKEMERDALERSIQAMNKTAIEVQLFIFLLMIAGSALGQF